MQNDLYTQERDISDINDCYFYHTIELPGYGIQKGEWDLRDHIDDYLGHVDFSNKRVLDVGAANGFLCFSMEQRGAEVVGYDLSKHSSWDIVPYDASIPEDFAEQAKAHIDKLNNAFWLSRKALNSKVKMVNGSVYEIPETIGPFDISVFGSILLHVRDPFLALQKAAVMTTDKIIVTDIYSEQTKFIPSQVHGRRDTWWNLSPDMIVSFLEVLGFPDIEMTRHNQKFDVTGNMKDLFTVVAKKSS